MSEHEHEHEHTYTHTHEHEHDGQEHSHEHTHSYTHSHEHSHDAGESHEHTHDHEHEDHEHGHHHHHETPENKEQVVALLDYTCKHNLAHADELPKLADKLKSLGHEDAAGKVTEAAGFFAQGNEALGEALKLLKGNS